MINFTKNIFVLLFALVMLTIVGCGGGGGGGGTTANPAAADVNTNIVADTIVKNQLAQMVTSIVGTANALNPKNTIRNCLRAGSELVEPGRYTYTYAPGDTETDSETGIVETYTSGKFVVSFLDINGNLTNDTNYVESILFEGSDYKYSYKDSEGISHNVTNEFGKLLVTGYYTAYSTIGLSLSIQNYHLSAVSTNGNYTFTIPSSTFYYEQSSWPYPKSGSSLGMTVTSNGITGTISVTFDGTKLAAVSAVADNQHENFLLDLSNGVVYQAVALRE